MTTCIALHIVVLRDLFFERGFELEEIYSESI